MNVVDGEETKWDFVGLTWPNDSEDENYAKSCKLFFLTIPFLGLSEENLFSRAAVFKHAPWKVLQNYTHWLQSLHITSGAS